MKKFLSVLLVIAMLSSAFIAVIPANAYEATSEDIDKVEALYFAPGKTPTIDGFISEAEWGSSTFTVEASDCATVDDSTPYCNFLYWRTGDSSDYSTWTYTVWLRWSENYFYIGCKVNDPDGHQNKNAVGDTWNGDALQVRIDKVGANAAADPAGGEFKVTGLEKNGKVERPWSSTTVPDFLFGYVEVAGGFTEAWENVANKGMTSFSQSDANMQAQCVVAPADSSYSSDTQNGITTYEVAIPWTQILNGETDKSGNQITALKAEKYTEGRKGNLTGAIGRNLGISLVVLDDGTNPDPKYDAYMAWGSGVCNVVTDENENVLGSKVYTGSNQVTLSGTSVTQAAGYTTYNPSSLLNASFDTSNVDKPNVFYDYLAGDTAKSTPVKYSELSCLTYDEDPDGDLSVWGASEYKGKVTNVGGTHGNVLDYSNFIGKDQTEAASDTQTYIDSRDGELRYQFPTSYTFEFDIKYNSTVVCAPNYDSTLYNWFGGSNSIAYQCGYFFNDNAFKIVNTYDESQVIASYPYTLKKDNWYNWKFQFDNDSCTARLWIDDLSTTADNAEHEWGTLVFNDCWRYFYYSSEEALTDGCLMIFRMLNVQCQYDNVKIYNFGSTEEIAIPQERSGSDVIGGNSGSGSVATGDGMLFVALAFAVASIGTSVIIIKRRKVTD